MTTATEPAAVPEFVKPRYRGVSHQVAFFAVLLAGPVLVVVAVICHLVLVTPLIVR